MAKRAATRHVVCAVDELPTGARKIVEIDGRSIGVFNVHGEYYAIRNVCPHQRAPLCLGKITGTTLPSRPGEFRWAKDGQIIRCPWHGWEFDIKTGQSVFNPHKMRVKRYDVGVEDKPAHANGGDARHTDAVTDPAPSDPALERYDVTVEQRMIVLYM